MSPFFREMHIRRLAIPATLTGFGKTGEDNGALGKDHRESRLPGEVVGVEDVHFHPVEPFTVRGSVRVKF
ncbi:MAG: hypothetical protein AB7O49_19930 [Sphingomonadales bacterium]